MKNVLILFTSMTLSLILSSMVSAYAQETVGENTETTDTGAGPGNSNQITIEIRGIDSLTSPNLVGLVYTENDAAAQKVDVNRSVIMPNQGNETTDPERMIDVPITLNNPVEEGKEVTACVLELAPNPIDNTTFCNIAFASPPSTGVPQKIIVIM
jgi:hypothetical protein